MGVQGRDAKLQHIYQDESPWAKLIQRTWPEPLCLLVATARNCSLASVQIASCSAGISVCVFAVVGAVILRINNVQLQDEYLQTGMLIPS